MEGSEQARAPQELDERVALEMSTHAPIADLLKNLSSQGAPSVLARLVAEELATPSKAVAERFVGDLPKVAAPATGAPATGAPATGAPGRGLSGRFGTKSWLGPVVGLAAAVVGAMLIGPYFGESGSTVNGLPAAANGLPAAGNGLPAAGNGLPAAGNGLHTAAPFMYHRVQADSVAAMDPVAAALVDGLSGGALLEQSARRQALLSGASSNAPQPFQPTTTPVGPGRLSVSDTGGLFTSSVAPVGSSTPNGTSNGGSGMSNAEGSSSLLALAASANLTVPLDGDRLVEIFMANGALLSHRERLRVDDAGGTLLETIQVVSSGSLDPLEYEILQAPRAGFYVRYRDARVRDLDLLVENYFVAELSDTATVAGRTCAQLELTPRSGEATIGLLRFSVDIETGVLLGLAEYDRSGQLGLRVTFESILYGQPPPFLPNLLLNDEQVMGADELSSALGIELLNPVFVPTGYVLVERAAVAVKPEERWSKATYTDGADVLFFLHRQADIGDTGRSPAIQRPGQPEVGGPLVQVQDEEGGESSKPQVWVVYQIGSLTVIWGQVGDRDLSGVGRVGPDEIQLMLESTL